VRSVFFVMVGVRYHLDLREIEGNVVGAFSKENKGERGSVRGSLGVVWCGGGKGLAQPHGADLAWGGVWRSSHNLAVIFLFFYSGGFSFRFLTHVHELDFIFFLSCYATSTFYIILIKPLV
jgi:hypothetical protein